MPPYPWTDPTVSAGTRIKAVHFTEMGGATQDLWNTKNMGNIPNWSSGVAVAPGNRIFASNTTDLRLWLNLYEDHGSVHGPARGIHLRVGADLRDPEDIQALNALRPEMVVALRSGMGPNAINYLKSIQANAEIFVRYNPTTKPVVNTQSIVDPAYTYTHAYPNSFGDVVARSPQQVAQDIKSDSENWINQGLVAFRVYTGNEPDLEWDQTGDARWWTHFWQDVDHYYRDIYRAAQDVGVAVELYPPAIGQFSSVGVRSYQPNGTLLCAKVTANGRVDVDCATYVWQSGDRGFDLIETMLDYHRNGTVVGRVLVLNYFWPGYQAEQAVFNRMPQWLKDKITTAGWPNRVTEFGWIRGCFDPPCNADLDSTFTSCDGARSGSSSWGDYNDFVRISGKMAGYAAWLVSSQSPEWSKWVAVPEGATTPRTWFNNLISFYNHP